ncbi:hypothetical protein ACSBR1_000871 [Camellia fascicularis]
MSSQAKQQTHNPCPPHAVCIPYPAQGHINPMLKLAKLLHHKGFHITFINTEFNHRRLLKSQGHHSISGTPSFRFETIPDGLPPSELDATQDIPALCHSILHNFLNPFRVLLAKLNPPVTCVVSDVGMAFTVKVAEELGIPDVFFNTASASGFMGYMQYLKSNASIGSILWKEQHDCLPWLDSKEPNSVVYVNCGSITVMTSQQLIEFAWGLVNSKKTFLWVIRPDLVVDDSAILPPDFVNETKERGLLASWCPQEQVLSHPSVGGFLTHCGWNSTLESICSGVPMLCWPFFAEQQTNCWLCCKEWGIGMEINSDVKREEVESLITELMGGGEKGKEMKRKVMEWKKLGEEATASSVGPSYLDFEKVVNCVLKSFKVVFSQKKCLQCSS